MAFDFKKEYKSLYLPKARPEIVQVPQMHYIAVRGQGDPNEPGGAYQQAIGVLYAVAYTLKMSYKTDHKIEGFFEYVVPPLEGFWLRSGAQMDTYLLQNGYENDLRGDRLHHEIYLSDPRKTTPEKRKTVIRHPIKRAE